MSEPRYIVKQNGHKRWVIANASDPQLVWAGSHWGSLNRWHLDWATEEAANNYAQRVLGE
jgi:hypothetical protein